VPVTVVPFTTPYWTGSLSFKPTSRFTSNAASTDKDKMRACRYLATPAGYTLQSEPLANQNFLVIRAGDDSDSFHCSDAGLIAL
jgi:hypothetical protein